MKRMMTMWSGLAALALTACGDGEEPVADDINSSENASAMINNLADPAPAPTVDGSPPPEADAAPGAQAPAPASTIPAALHGRWGMTPADCTSTRGDAKGLLTISAGELRFYESRAVPKAPAESSANSINGTFAFTGEGQSWSRYQSLERQGDKLARTERDPNASYTYLRCD